MTLETQSLVLLIVASFGNGFVGGIAAFVVALRWHRKKDAEAQRVARIADVRKVLDGYTVETLGREASTSEVNFYMPRMLSGELSDHALLNLLHVERSAAHEAPAGHTTVTNMTGAEYLAANRGAA